MKPHVAYRIVATREAVEKAFGPKVGELFVPNPHVDEYAAVLRFPDTKVIVGGALNRALRKLATVPGPLLISARDMTIEARRIARDAGCDVLTRSEFGWTDDSYQRIRQT